MAQTIIPSPNKFIDSFVNIAKYQYKSIWIDIKNFFSIFNENIIFLIKVFILAISFGLLIFILILIKKSGYWSEIIFDDFLAFIVGEKRGKKDKQEICLEIKKLSKSNDKNKIKLAIIKADNLLEKILNQEGYIEGNFEENLLDFLTEEDIKNIFNDLKKAHLFRKKIELEKENLFTIEEARTFLEVYNQVFRKLGYTK